MFWLLLIFINLIQNELHPFYFFLCEKMSREIKFQIMNSGPIPWFPVQNLHYDPV